MDYLDQALNILYANPSCSTCDNTLKCKEHNVNNCGDYYPEPELITETINGLHMERKL